MKERASALFATRTHPCILVRSAGRTGAYWGRGRTIKEAIKAAMWIGSQDTVYIMQCDEKAHCGEIDGALYSTSRGPIYYGKVTSKSDDVLVTKAHDPNPKDTPVID